MVSKKLLKLYVPHHFNTPENQKCIGSIPEIKHVGANDMKVEDLPDFNKWYLEQADITYWNFKYEVVKYCRADVAVLCSAVLVFRKMFYENLNIDPFIYIILHSLCMNIYKGRF